MTMVNSTVSSTPNRGGVSLRKTNKPLMEKRRRARINDSLSQLKSLVIHSSKKDSSQFSKLEKADILELTVKHLRGLQAQQQQQHHIQQQQQHHLHHPQQPTDTQGKYRAGFVECANEVIRYMDQSQGLNHETKNKVVGHLANCLQHVSTTTHNNQAAKITPQPVPQSVMPQQQPQPNNAAAILAAAAAAAGNTTTTTTLPNGQIIQIVSNPLQNVQPIAAGPTILGLNTPANKSSIQGVLSTHSDQLPQQTSVNTTAQVSTKSIPKQLPTTNTVQPAYIHYAQPLHIQIPPIVSPVLIHKESQQVKQMEIRVHNKSFSSSSPPSSLSSSTSSNPSCLPDQVNDIVSSSSMSTSPRRMSTSPPTLYPGHPKARAQKHLNFLAQEELRSEKYSRTYKHSSSTSSSCSSSSESENSSPLNLSQSPQFTMYNKSEQRNLFSTVSQKDLIDQNQSVYMLPIKSSLHSERVALKDGGNNLHYAPNATSVIVNSRKCSDFSEGKYWMMEEERHCSRHHNTPSPASSVGEDRLWRPW